MVSPPNSTGTIVDTINARISYKCRMEERAVKKLRFRCNFITTLKQGRTRSDLTPVTLCENEIRAKSLIILTARTHRELLPHTDLTNKLDA
jgi:hypothetical protein